LQDLQADLESLTSSYALDFDTANEQPTSVCSVDIVVVRGSEIVDSFYNHKNHYWVPAHKRFFNNDVFSLRFFTKLLHLYFNYYLCNVLGKVSASGWTSFLALRNLKEDSPDILEKQSVLALNLSVGLKT